MFSKLVIFGDFQRYLIDQNNFPCFLTKNAVVCLTSAAYISAEKGNQNNWPPHAFLIKTNVQKGRPIILVVEVHVLSLYDNNNNSENTNLVLIDLKIVPKNEHAFLDKKNRCFRGFFLTFFILKDFFNTGVLLKFFKIHPEHYPME